MLSKLKTIGKAMKKTISRRSQKVKSKFTRKKPVKANKGTKGAKGSKADKKGSFVYRTPTPSPSPSPLEIDNPMDITIKMVKNPEVLETIQNFIAVLKDEEKIINDKIDEFVKEAYKLNSMIDNIYNREHSKEHKQLMFEMESLAREYNEIKDKVIERHNKAMKDGGLDQYDVKFINEHKEKLNAIKDRSNEIRPALIKMDEEFERKNNIEELKQSYVYPRFLYDKEVRKFHDDGLEFVKFINDFIEEHKGNKDEAMQTFIKQVKVKLMYHICLSFFFFLNQITYEEYLPVVILENRCCNDRLVNLIFSLENDLRSSGLLKRKIKGGLNQDEMYFALILLIYLYNLSGMQEETIFDGEVIGKKGFKVYQDKYESYSYILNHLGFTEAQTNSARKKINKLIKAISGVRGVDSPGSIGVGKASEDEVIISGIRRKLLGFDAVKGPYRGTRKKKRKGNKKRGSKRKWKRYHEKNNWEKE